MYSKIAARTSSRDLQILVSINSDLSVAKKLSATALSQQSPFLLTSGKNIWCNGMLVLGVRRAPKTLTPLAFYPSLSHQLCIALDSGAAYTLTPCIIAGLRRL